MNRVSSYYSKGRASRLGAAVWLYLLVFLAAGTSAFGQVEASAYKGGLLVSAGGTFSGDYVGYGQRKMLGEAAFVDVGSKAHLTFEGEAHWINLNQIANVRAETYLAGPRYSIKEFGRFTPYAKVLVGDGEFHFPYNYAHGSYLVVAPGAGVDWRLNSRVYLRLVDFDYQYWNQFTYGSLPTYGVSTGVRVRIF